jgi:Spy/CpxP family protein refolding chaperone
MRPRARFIAVGLLLLSFVVGGLSGMAVEEAAGIDWFEFLDSDNDDRDDRLLAGLDLTKDQRSRAEELLERQERTLEQYWETRLPELRRMLDSTYAEIRLMLTPPQQALFDRKIRQLDGDDPAEHDE